MSPRIHGWIIFDKPVGMGSTQAVSAVKRMLRGAGFWGTSKKDRPKVGHGGTLDPLASGVLPIAIGEATKLTGRLLDASKIYDFTIRFGTQTDTLDAAGEAVAESTHRPSFAEIEAVLPDFTGSISQVPPVYSALKIDGKRAYDRARSGEDIAMKARGVAIYSLAISGSEGAGRLEAVTLTAHVSKGTYIRSLARDIAAACGTVGHVTMLRRTKAGPFGLQNAISLDKLDEIANGAPIEAALLPLEAGLVDIPALRLTDRQADLVKHGGRLDGITERDGLYLAKSGNDPVALMELEVGQARIVRGFNV